MPKNYQMNLTTSDNYSYKLTRIDAETIEVEADPEAIEAMLDTITLVGTQEVPVGDVYRPSGVQVLMDSGRPSDRRIALREGTAAMWVQFEILNYL